MTRMSALIDYYMFELHFDKVTLGKANRYVMMVTTSQGMVELG